MTTPPLLWTARALTAPEVSRSLMGRRTSWVSKTRLRTIPAPSATRTRHPSGRSRTELNEPWLAPTLVSRANQSAPGRGSSRRTTPPTYVALAQHNLEPVAAHASNQPIVAPVTAIDSRSTRHSVACLFARSPR